MNKIRDYLEDMQEEIAILQDIDHVNLIEYYGMDAHEVKEPSHMIGTHLRFLERILI